MFAVTIGQGGKLSEDEARARRVRIGLLASAVLALILLVSCGAFWSSAAGKQPAPPSSHTLKGSSKSAPDVSSSSPSSVVQAVDGVPQSIVHSMQAFVQRNRLFVIGGACFFILAVVAVVLAVVLTQEPPVQDLPIDDPEVPKQKPPVTPPPKEEPVEGSYLHIIIPVVCGAILVLSILGFVVFKKCRGNQPVIDPVLQDNAQIGGQLPDTASSSQNSAQLEELQQQFVGVYERWREWYETEYGGPGQCSLDKSQMHSPYVTFQVHVKTNPVRNVYCYRTSDLTLSKILWTIRNHRDYRLDDNSLIEFRDPTARDTVLNVFEFESSRFSEPGYLDQLIQTMEHIQQSLNLTV